MKRDAKFEEKLTSGLENDMRNIQIFTRALEGPKIEPLVGFFYPKQNMYWLICIEKLCAMTAKNDVKFEAELSAFKNHMRNLANFQIEI